MWHQVLKRLSIVVCGLIVLWNTPLPSANSLRFPYYQKNAPTLDIIFMIDQSDSMVGTNDPQGFALEAARRGFDLLSAQLYDQRLAPTDQQIDQQVRVGVILFGSTFTDSGPLTPLQLAFRDTRSISITLPSLLEVPPTSKGDGTRFSTALRRACAMFGGGDDCSVPLEQEHQRLLILLTDGAPRAGSNANKELPEKGIGPKSTPAELRAYAKKIHEQIPTLLESNAHIVVFGIDQTGQTWAKSAIAWEGIATDGTTSLLNAEEALVQFQEKLGDLFTSQPSISKYCGPDGSFQVPPYLATMSMLATGENVRFEPPQGTPPLIDSNDAIANRIIGQTKSQLSQFLVIQRPASGIWRCIVEEGPQPQFRVRFGRSLIANTYLVPDMPGMPDPCATTLNYTFAYTGTDGLAIASQSGPPIHPILAHPQAGIHIDDSDRLVVDVPDDGGSYTLAITATIDRDKALRVPEIRTPSYVSSSQPCAIEVFAPKAGEAITLTKVYRPIPVSLRLSLLDRHHSPLVSDLFAPTISLTGPQGSIVLPPLHREKGAWLAEVDTLTVGGSYLLTATVALTGRSIITTVPFRRPIDPWQRRADAGLWMFVALVMGLLALGCSLLWWQLHGPFPTGVLMIRASSGNVSGTKRYVLAEQRGRWNVRKRQIVLRTPAPRQAHIARIHIEPQGQNIRVSIHWRVEKPSHITLQPNEECQLTPDVTIAYDHASISKIW